MHKQNSSACSSRIVSGREHDDSTAHSSHTHHRPKTMHAPIKAPSCALPPLTSSHKRVATDNVEAPPHRHESWGRRPAVPRHHRLCRRSRRPRLSELRLMTPRRLAIVVQSGVDRRRQTTSSLSRLGFNRQRQDTGTQATLAV